MEYQLRKHWTTPSGEVATLFRTLRMIRSGERIVKAPGPLPTTRPAIEPPRAVVVPRTDMPNPQRRHRARPPPPEPPVETAVPFVYEWGGEAKASTF